MRRDDDKAPIARNDSLILSFGELLSSGQAISKYLLVSQHMWQMAQLLIQLRENAGKPDANHESFLKPEGFDTVV